MSALDVAFVALVWALIGCVVLYTLAFVVKILRGDW